MKYRVPETCWLKRVQSVKFPVSKCMNLFLRMASISIPSDILIHMGWGNAIGAGDAAREERPPITIHGISGARGA